MSEQQTEHDEVAQAPENDTTENETGSDPVSLDETADGAEGFEDVAQADAEAESKADRPPLILPEDLPAQVEAALLTSERPMASARVADALGLSGASAAIEEAIGELNEVYQRSGRSFRIEKVAGSWQVVTLPKYAGVLDGLKRAKQDNKLSASQLETLAIVAYKQPVVRADIEAVRGAASGEVLRALMDKHLVKIVGRAEELGRPMLYGTTKQFLEVFGLGTLKDLPEVDQLRPVV